MIKIVRVDGLSELLEALEELPKATGTNVQKRVLIKAAEPMRNDAQRMAPRRTGKLQERMNISTKLSARQKSLHHKESKVEVFVGPYPLVQAITQEFGTVHHAPHPFMRPAWDANKKSTLETIRELLAVEIEKARQRLARKATRLLAKT